MERRRNQLPSNLPQLQNLIKRDPSAYHEEVEVAKTYSRFIFGFLIVYAAVPPLPELTTGAAFVSYAKFTQLR